MRARNIHNPSLSTKAVIAGQQAPSCAIVGESELERVRRLADQKDVQKQLDENARRENLRLLSDQRVSQWPNTLEAQRIRKDKLKKERLEEEERRRQLIDQEEEELRQAAKQRVLDNANRHQYEQNDKIKAFTSKLFLASVLADREQQIEVTKERKQQEAQEAKEWLKIEQELRAKADAEEDRKIKAMKEKATTLKSGQLSQLDDIRQRKIAERDANRAEGERIKRAAQDMMREQEEAERKRKEQQKQSNHDLVIANLENERLKEERRIQEKLEEGKIAVFAELKDKQVLERKKRAEERHTAKLGRRQEIIDAQAERLAAIQAAVEEREMKAMRDFDKERQERERREKDLRDRRQKEIADFREEQRQRDEEARDKKALEEDRMKHVWKQRSEMLIDEELHERQLEREKAERLQRFHLLQHQEKKQQSLLEKRKEIEEGIFLQEALKNEQEMYESYVNAVMGDYVQNGREATVVDKAARLKKRV